MALDFTRHFRFQRRLARLWFRRIGFWIGALAVSAAAILFAWTANLAFALFHRLTAPSPYLAIVIAPLSLMAIVYVTRRFFPGAQGSGIPQVIVAIRDPTFAQSGMLSLKVASGKMVLTLLGLVGGASIGREGPTVQIGAAVMLALGRSLGLAGDRLSRALALGGGAAGVAAAFNTPLAGVVFAIEELAGSFEHRTSGTVLTAVIVAGIASLAVLGDYTYFGHSNAALNLANGALPVLTCGVVGGLLGGAFARLLIAMTRGIPGFAGRFAGTHPLLFALICGLAIAAIGIFSNGTTYGTGYDETRALFAGQAPALGGWGLLKLAATLVSYASGVPGGIFSPSLAAGAGIGAEIALWLPHAPLGAVILLGMTAYFSGVVQAPITAVVIVLEMTDNQSMTLPLMAAAFIAFSISRLVCRKALYRALADSFMRRQAAPIAQPGR